MPDEILNPDLYQDRTVQDWHRQLKDAHGEPLTKWKAIDLDLMGYCHICRDPLYLIESTTNEQKATTVMRALARRAQLPAFVVLHNRLEILQSRLVANPFSDRKPLYSGSTELQYALGATRVYHHQMSHGNNQ